MEVLKRYYRQVAHQPSRSALADRRQLQEIYSPEELAQLEEPVVRETAARLAVIADCLPKLPVDKHRQLALPSHGPLIASIRKHNPGLSAGHIEMVAMTHHVFDELWPIEDIKAHLKVDPQELEDFLARQRVINYRARANTRNKITASVRVKQKSPTI